MNEPILYRQINVDYSVRLTRFTDEVDAFSLRIDRLSNGEIFSSYKRFSYFRAGELNPRPTAVIAHKLAPAEFSRLTDEIGRQDFFALPEQTASSSKATSSGCSKSMTAQTSTPSSRP